MDSVEEINEAWLKYFSIREDIERRAKESDVLRSLLSELYGYLLQSDRDGEATIPAELGERIEKALGVE